LSQTLTNRGAQILKWRIGNHDLLWNGRGGKWDAIAPLLFPVVGHINGNEIRIAEDRYPMMLHGFIAGQDFQVKNLYAESVHLSSCSNETSLKFYPFFFQFDVFYTLYESALESRFIITNTGLETMPFAFGVHPGFRWPLFGDEKSDYVFRFEKPESALVPVITKDGLFRSANRKIENFNGQDLVLSPYIFQNEALCFLNTSSRQAVIEHSQYGFLKISTENFSHWALWSYPEAPFLCIENWSGYGDPENFDGEFAQKPSMRFLEPGQQEIFKVLYEVRYPQSDEI